MTANSMKLSANRQYSLPEDLVDAGHAGHVVSWLKKLAGQNMVRWSHMTHHEKSDLKVCVVVVP